MKHVVSFDDPNPSAIALAFALISIHALMSGSLAPADTKSALNSLIPSAFDFAEKFSAEMKRRNLK